MKNTEDGEVGSDVVKVDITFLLKGRSLWTMPKFVGSRTAWTRMVWACFVCVLHFGLLLIWFKDNRVLTGQAVLILRAVYSVYISNCRVQRSVFGE